MNVKILLIGKRDVCLFCDWSNTTHVDWMQPRVSTLSEFRWAFFGALAVAVVTRERWLRAVRSCASSIWLDESKLTKFLIYSHKMMQFPV